MKKVLSFFLMLFLSTTMWGETPNVPDNAPDVMLQAFYWDSYPGGSGSAYGNTGWSTLLNQVDELGEYFDLVWLPPCSQSSGGTGYIPKQYSNLNSDWGSEADLRSLISKLKAKGTRSVADIVVNHITGNSGWCSFATMDFGSYGKFYPEASWICNTDEMNYESGAGSCQGSATGNADDGYGDEANYTAARDWDHNNAQVREMCRAYLKWLKNDVGFDGWRYDYGKGFHHSHINDYNTASGAYMSVVEYWDGNSGVIRSRLEDASWNNMAFDFGTKYDALNDGICAFNYAKCQGAGLLGAGLGKHAVTFVDNHDTFQRNDSEFGGKGNSMSSGLKDRLLQANAFILSMPGIPCVFYPHWVTYKSEIKAMIEARHLVGVHSQSEVKDEYAEQGGYQATIVGTNGYIVLQLGNKAGNTIQGFTKKASGNGYAIWIYTNTVDHFYITGNVALVGDKSWKADAIKVTGNTYTFSNLAAGKDYQLKVTLEGTWDTAKGFSDLTTTADGLSGDNEGNICFSLSEAGDVKVTYTGSVFKLEGKFGTSGSGSGEQQTTTKFYITGNAALIGDLAWNPAAIAVEEDSYTIDNLPAGNSYQLKITTDGTWNTAKGYSDLTTTAEGLSTDNDGNVCFSLSKAGSVTVTYTGSVFKVEVKLAEDPEQPETPEEPVDSVTVYFVNALDWANVNTFVWPIEGSAYKEWPGEAAKKEAENVNGNEVYSYKFPKSFANVIFNNGATQTTDLTWNESKPYFYPTGIENKQIIGTWYAKDKVPAAVVPAKFYITGDSALVVDAGAGFDKKWNAAAIKSEKDTFELELKADQYYVLKLTLNGTWEGENNIKGYNELTEEIEGLEDVSDDHNIGFKLSEAGKVQVIYFVKNNKTTFKLVGKFVTEGGGSGEQPTTNAKFYVTGDTALVVAAGADKMKAWKADAIKSEKDTLVLNLPVGEYHLKVVVDGNWEGGKVKGFDALTEPKTTGLSADGDGNIVFTLDEASEVKVIYTDKLFKLDGKFHVETPAKFYITGDTALVVDAGLDKMKAWKADAIKSEKDTFELELKANQYYVLKLTLNGTWEGENNVKGFNELTEEIEGLEDVSDDHNIGFKLSEAGKVQVIYFVKDNKETFKLVGKFVTEGGGSGDDPQPTTKYFMKNNWNGGEDWIWKEMVAAENNTFKLEKVVFGGTGVNYNTKEDSEGQEWVAIENFAGDEIGALDTVTFVLDLASENKVKAILLGKYQEEQGGGDDPQPVDSVTVYFVNNLSWTNVNAFVWGEKVIKEWPGEAAKKEADKLQGFDVYSYKFPKTYVNIIFNTVIGEEGVQTADLKWTEAKPYFYPTEKNGEGKYQGEWYAKDEVPAVVVPAKFYITGDSALVVDAGCDKSQAWAENAIKSEKDTFELDLKADQDYVLKLVVNGNWLGYNALSEVADGLKDVSDDHNIGFKLSEDGKVQVIYFVKDNKTTFKLVGKFVVPEPTPEIADGYYLMGTFNNWKPAEEYLFKENSQNPGEYYLNITLKVNDELKVAKVVNGKAEPWYPAEGDNYIVDADHAGAKTIYFQPDYKEAWDAFGGYIYIEANKPTDIDALQNADKATKLFHNGQLLIIRGTRTYTVMGQLVQ